MSLARLFAQAEDRGTPRQVVKCPSCKLTQYMTESRYCRRCEQLLEEILRLPPPRMGPPVLILRPSVIVATFHARLRTERETIRMSQLELERRTKIPRTTISRYESGTFMPSVAALEKISGAMGTSIGYLLSQSLGWVTNDPFVHEVATMAPVLNISQREAIIDVVRSVSHSTITNGMSHAAK